MVVVGLKLIDNEISTKFFKDTHTRLTTPTYKNFFCKGIVKSFNELHIIYLDILFVKFYYLGLMFVVGSLIWNKGTIGWSIIPGLLFSTPYIFWNSTFNYYIIKLGLRKAGYKGNIKKVSLNDIIYKVISNE